MQQRAIRAGSCRERRYADHIFIQIYFRMHHFVVIAYFLNILRLRRQGGIDPPNQNPADVPGDAAIIENGPASNICPVICRRRRPSTVEPHRRSFCSALWETRMLHFCGAALKFPWRSLLTPHLLALQDCQTQPECLL